MDEQTLVTVSVANALEGDEAVRFRAIYEEAFPPEERDEFDSLAASIRGGERRCLIARTGGVLTGFAVSLPLVAVPVALLEYLAVDATARSQGIGAALFSEVITQAQRWTPPARGVLLEVERVEDAPTAEERRQRERRIAFYARHECVTIECAPAYETPSLQGPGLIPYTLLWAPLPGGAPVPRGEFLAACIRAVLTESYELAGEDPLVQRVLSRLDC